MPWHLTDGWAVSAGTKPGKNIHSGAIRLMLEIGIDISRQQPKPLDLALAERASRVIAMCDLGACPAPVLARLERWPITDPAALPESKWREIRDEIGRRVRALLADVRALPAETPPAS